MNWKSQLAVERFRQKLTTASEETTSPEALKARESLAAFGKYVGQVEAMPHHQRWIRTLVSERDTECLHRIAGEDSVILSPRGSGKSYWIGLFLAWAIGHNPSLQIIYASSSESIAISRGKIIRRLIESEAYQKVFPRVRPSKSWSDRRWEIDKTKAGVSALESDFTFYAVGITGSIVSRRSHLIIMDDLIKSSDSIFTQKSREAIAQSYHQLLAPTLIPGGRSIALGTRFRKDDIFATDFTPQKGWQVLVQPAIVKNSEGGEESYWVERFSLDYLEGLREADPGNFALQYQNDISDESLIHVGIRPEWLRRVDIPKCFDCLSLGVDLASSTSKRGDFTAMVICGWNERNPRQRWVLEAIRGRWGGNAAKIEQIARLWNDWSALLRERGRMTIFFESVAYQSSFEDDWTAHLRSLPYPERPRASVRGITPRGTKFERLQRYSGALEEGSIAFNRYLKFNDLFEEIVDFGYTSYDDLSDAFTLAMTGAERLPLEASSW